METVTHTAKSRGHFNYGWLDTYHTFSFARYFDPERVNFGALRVLNDDIILPGEGFGRHPHDNMEIITIPLSGAVLHRDSMNHEQIIKPGEVQVMSAGSGIYHEEYNASDTYKLNLLQVWVYPNEKNVKPRYDQRSFDPNEALNNWQVIVSNNEDNSLFIHQDASISRVFLSEGFSITYDLKQNRGAYIFMVDGSGELNEAVLSKRDGLGVSGEGIFEIKAKSDAYILNFDVPL